MKKVFHQSSMSTKEINNYMKAEKVFYQSTMNMKDINNYMRVKKVIYLPSKKNKEICENFEKYPCRVRRYNEGML